MVAWWVGGVVTQLVRCLKSTYREACGTRVSCTVLMVLVMMVVVVVVVVVVDEISVGDCRFPPRSMLVATIVGC